MPRSERQPRVTRAQRAAANRAAADAANAADAGKAPLTDQTQADVVHADDPPLTGGPIEGSMNDGGATAAMTGELNPALAGAAVVGPTVTFRDAVEDPDHVKDAVKIMAAMDELATLVSGDVRRLHPELADVFNCYAAEKPAIDERMKRVLARGRRQRFGR